MGALITPDSLRPEQSGLLGNKAQNKSKESRRYDFSSLNGSMTSLDFKKSYGEFDPGSE